MKILLSWGHHGWMRRRTERMLADLIARGHAITSVNHRDRLGEDRTYGPDDLLKRYRDGFPPMVSLYEEIETLAQSHDVLMVIYDNVYVPEFLEKLKMIYRVYFCEDDPEGSEERSRPYVHAYDHSFAAAVNYDATTRTWQKYREWGARHASWFPVAFGIAPDDHDGAAKLTDEDFHAARRPMDAIFVGRADPSKVARVVNIARAAGVNVHGVGWSRYLDPVWSLPYWRARMPRGADRSRYLPDERLVATYRATKIGLNIHESFGPCNRRMFALPASGVMQICDCPEGLGEVFEIGKEVVVYRTVNDAADLIRFYLEHDVQRRTIAAAGYQRVMRDYLSHVVFQRIMARIRESMIADGIYVSKSGAPL